MKIFLALFFCLFLSKTSFADSTLYDFTVSDIISDQVIQIQNISKNIDVKVGDIFAIYSHVTSNVIGYAEVVKISDFGDFLEATVSTHHQSGLVRPGNYLVRLDLSKVDNSIPARIELLTYSNRKIASKYRHMVYTGFFLGQTAQTLIKNEAIAGPSFLAYGLSDRLQVHSNVLNSFFAIPNIGYKYLLVRNQEFALAFSQELNYSTENRRSYHEFNFHLDSYSNSKFLSFAKLKFFTKRPETKSLSSNSGEYFNDISTELQLAYGYVTDEWNRIIFGPKVDFEKQKVGGSIGYYFIDKEFRMLIGVSANDFSTAKLGRDGYILNLDFWWRF